MDALLENIETIVAIVIAICGFFYMNLRDLRKEMREDIGKLDTKLDAKFDKLHDLMMKYIIDPAAAKQEAANNSTKQKEGGPKPPSE